MNELEQKNVLRQVILEEFVELNGQPRGKTINFDAYVDSTIESFLQALPEDVDTKGTQVGDGYNTALRDVRNILNEARNAK